MIEIRTYEGDAVELSSFVEGVWRDTYGGRMIFPLWDASYFDWQLLAERPGGRDYLVAAYDGARLVGTLLAEPCRFRLRGREHDGTTRSWLTVHADYRRQGVATLLAEAMRRRYAERGVAFSLGFLYVGSAGSAGPKFWLKRPEMVFLSKTGFWVRVLDHKAASRWELSWLNGIGARALGLLQGRCLRPRDSTGIRPYRADDLSACVELVAGLQKRVDLSFIWTAQRLAHQLLYKDIPRTIVAEQAGRVVGFVNYYALDMMGRHPIKAAIIDLAAFGTMPLSDCKKLLQTALSQMAGEGIAFSLMLRLSCYPWPPFVTTGFLPLPRDLCVMGNVTDPAISLEGIRRLHVNFR